MAMTVGIMGFGRIGRNVFRILYKRDDILIGAVSDLGDTASVEYLLKFDTLFGRFPDEISAKGGHLYVVGRQIALLAGQEKGVIPPWGDLGVDIVVEATARRLTRAELEKHLEAGAKRVILCDGRLQRTRYPRRVACDLRHRGTTRNGGVGARAAVAARRSARHASSPRHGSRVVRRRG